MSVHVNKPIGFVLDLAKQPEQPFIVLTLTLRCGCCGQLKPQWVTTMGMN